MLRCQLQGSDLRGADLRGADLGESGCIQVNFEGANLDGLRAQRGMFLSARLADCSVRGADLHGALFHAAAIEGVRFEHCAMREVSWEKSRMRDIGFSDCDLRDTRFDHATLDDGEFVRVQLQNSSFHNTRQTDVRMRAAKRKGMRGTNATLLEIEAPTLELEDIPCAP